MSKKPNIIWIFVSILHKKEAPAHADANSLISMLVFDLISKVMNLPKYYDL